MALVNTLPDGYKLLLGSVSGIQSDDFSIDDYHFTFSYHHTNYYGSYAFTRENRGWGVQENIASATLLIYKNDLSDFNLDGFFVSGYYRVANLSITLQYSNDNSTWTDIVNCSGLSKNVDYYCYEPTSNINAKYYRLYIVNSGDNTNYVFLNFIQKYKAITSVNPQGSGTINDVFNNGVHTLTATANSGYSFLNWAVGEITQTNNPLSLTLTEDTTIIGNFEAIGQQITTQVSPSGYGTTSGDGTYAEGVSVTLQATANSGKQFVNWTLNDTIVSTNATYTFIMGSQAQTYIAHFENAPLYSINCKTNPINIGSVYQSEKQVYAGESVTLRAREENGWSFSHWSNGSVTNPLTITNVQNNINISANYVKYAQDNTYYQYRAYVKDSLSLNTLPKAFLVIRSFTIRRDLLTTSKSKFVCIDIPSNLNEGDVFVLYDPKGTIMYYGTISSIDDDSIQCNQIQSFYKGNWIYDTYATTSLEVELSYLLGRYASGFQKDSTYQDLLVNQEKAPLYIKTEGNTSNQLETYDEKKIMDFEKFIYSLYESYNLVFDFNIPYSAWTVGSSSGGSVTIRKPSNSVIKIGTNAECIQNMSPTTKIEQTNKLIIYGSDGTYRTTYVATTTNGIVEEPSSVVGRYGVVNTKVVYSDDELDDIKKANISADMFNHEITFTLLLDNNLYDFWSWELGQQLQIYDGTNYFDSVFTGYELSKKENQNPTEVKIICGKVRNQLTKLLTMGVVE